MVMVAAVHMAPPEKYGEALDYCDRIASTMALDETTYREVRAIHEQMLTVEKLRPFAAELETLFCMIAPIEVPPSFTAAEFEVIASCVAAQSDVINAAMECCNRALLAGAGGPIGAQMLFAESEELKIQLGSLLGLSHKMSTILEALAAQNAEILRPTDRVSAN